MLDDSTSNNQSQGNAPSMGPSLGLGINPNPNFISPATQSNEPAAAPPVITDKPAPASDVTNPKLEDIKTKALSQLSPLVSKLDQTPEERYKTLMMLIQASDNQDLLEDAYDAAQKIEDETVRAEALLSIVNEINYFTQQSNQQK